MNARSEACHFGTSTIGGTPYDSTIQRTPTRTNTGTELDLGENIIVIYGRYSSYHGLRGYDRRNTWVSQDDVVGDAIIVRKDVRVITEIYERDSMPFQLQAEI